MRSSSTLALAFAILITACQFEAHIGGAGNPQTPVANNAPDPAPTPAPTPGGTTPTNPTNPPDGRGTVNPLAGVKVGAPNPAPPFDPRVRPQVVVSGLGGAIPLVPNTTDFGSAKPETDSLVGLVYYLPGPADRLPDFSTIQPTYKLFSRMFSVGPQSFVGFNSPNGAPRNANFAVHYEGAFNVAKAGDYSLYLESKEGARLSVDGKVVIDNDGVHGRTYKNANLSWTDGAHKIAVDYFAGTSNDVALELWVSPKGAADSAKVWSPQVGF